jgi:phage FluMu gp28-like protein
MSETGAVLLPYQQLWLADKSQVKVAEKSRRVGLTWGEAANSALEASSANGQDTWYLPRHGGGIYTRLRLVGGALPNCG